MSGASSTVLFHTEALIDRRTLAACLPEATGAVMSARLGGKPGRWAAAYRRIQADWDSYWTDLNLSGEDSVAQWREGRWRIVAAHCRLMGMAAPGVEEIPVYLDDLPVEIGRRCTAFRPGVPDLFKALARERLRIAVVSPYLPAPLIKGMAEAAHVWPFVEAIIGPERLEQVGLEGIEGDWLIHLAGGEPDGNLYISSVPVPGLAFIPVQDDLNAMLDLILQRVHST